MWPELSLHDLARERQREMWEFAARSAQQGIGEEYLAWNSRLKLARKEHLYVSHVVQLLRNWASRVMVLDTRVRD